VPPKEQPLAVRLQTDDCWRDTVRLVGYLGLKTPISEADYKRLLEKYGRERLGKASEELVDIDQKKKLATLKADVRKRCQAILGPSPEDWDSFYDGIENPPPNPYLTAKPSKRWRSKKAKKEIDLVAEAIADAIREETGMDVEIRSPDVPAVHQADNEKTLLDKSEPYNPLEAFQVDVLTDRLNNARMRCLCSKTQKAQNRAYRDVQRLLAEYERRKTPPPAEPPEVQARKMVAAPGRLLDVTTLTDKRLQELLDMNLRELETNDRDTITYEEALRDIKLIEAERRRRDQAPDNWDEEVA
jgi:hypothetical protein